MDAQPRWMVQAQAVAQRKVQECFRKVLREVSICCLYQETQKNPQLNLASVQRIQSTVRNFVLRWKQALEEEGNEALVRILEETVEAEIDVLFYKEEKETNKNKQMSASASDEPATERMPLTYEKQHELLSKSTIAERIELLDSWTPPHLYRAIDETVNKIRQHHQKRSTGSTKSVVFASTLQLKQKPRGTRGRKKRKQVPIDYAALAQPAGPAPLDKLPMLQECNVDHLLHDDETPPAQWTVWGALQDYKTSPQQDARTKSRVVLLDTVFLWKMHCVWMQHNETKQLLYLPCVICRMNDCDKET